MQPDGILFHCGNIQYLLWEKQSIYNTFLQNIRNICQNFCDAFNMPCNFFAMHSQHVAKFLQRICNTISLGTARIPAEHLTA